MGASPEAIPGRRARRRDISTWPVAIVVCPECNAHSTYYPHAFDRVGDVVLNDRECGYHVTPFKRCTNKGRRIDVMWCCLPDRRESPDGRIQNAGARS